MVSKADAPHPAALGLVWRIASVVGAGAFAAALGLWKSDSLHTQEIATLRAELAAVSADLRAHVEADRIRSAADAERERDAAIQAAELRATVRAVGSSFDAFIGSQNPPRRRGPG